MDRYEHLLRSVRDEPLDAVALEALETEARRRNDWRGELMVLAHRPSAAAWRQICDLLECASNSELDDCLPWLTRLLDAHWPDGLRTLRAAWGLDQQRSDDPRRVRLARAATVDTGDALLAITGDAAYAGLRELTVTRGVHQAPGPLRGSVHDLLATATHLRALRRLDMVDCSVYDGDATRFDWRWLRHLTALTHLRARLSALGAESALSLPALRVLDLQAASRAGVWLEALVRSPCWPRLERLGLRQTGLDDDQAWMLTLFEAPSLVYLDVSFNAQLSLWGYGQILGSRRLPRLETVRAARYGGRKNPLYQGLVAIGDRRLELNDYAPPWLGACEL